MKNINDQIRAANENTENLLLGEFNFDPKDILNKKLIFDATIIGEELMQLMTHLMISIGQNINQEQIILHYD